MYVYMYSISLTVPRNKNEAFICMVIVHTYNLGPPLLIWIHFLFITAWISNYIDYKVWDEITYPFLTFNGFAVEV